MLGGLADHRIEELPELGVGITYLPALEPVLTSNQGLVDLIEIEPQSLWIRDERSTPKFRSLEGVFENITSLPFRKLVHSIGTPVGGSVMPDSENLALLASNVLLLGSPWVSDHLSFNATPQFHTGFFLPPRQTSAGIENAVTAIRKLQSAVDVPVAVETGVNYLRQRADEIPDGQFAAEVSKKSGCGILLDLHNLYCNHLNGRQSIGDFLSQISLDRVWEVHLAGGLEMDGYWLDAHSGAIPEPLVELCKTIFPKLPNLKAVVFEIFPSFVEEAGEVLICRQLEMVRSLWDMRGSASEGGAPLKRPQAAFGQNSADGLSPQDWEATLGSLVIGREVGVAVQSEIAADPAVGLVRGLIQEFRGSMIVSVLRLTTRLLILCLGAEASIAVLKEFWTKTPPKQFAIEEAEGFAAFIASLDLQVPHLLKTLEFERAAIDTLVSGQSRIVTFDFDPLPLFRALSEGRLPDVNGVLGDYEIELTPDGPVSASALDLESVRRAFPFH